MKTRSLLLFSLLLTALTIPLAKGTTLISPSAEGGFENGADFPTNGWTVVNGSNNRLFVGTAPVASAGTNCAFSGTTSSSWTGEALANVNHFYRDINFPAGESILTLTFKYKINATDPTFDFLKVFLVPTTTTPVAGTQLASGQVGLSAGYDSATTYTLVTITLPASAAGTTQRLVFSWRTDGASPNAAVAVDEISLTSTAPTLISGTRTIGTGGDFATLTAATSFLSTTGGVNGPLFLELLPTYTSGSESFPITFGNIIGNSATNTITVRPQSGASGLSIASSNTTATIDLNGAQNVIFDGRPGGTGTAKQLTLANTSTSGSAARFINDAMSDKLTFCTITGVNTSTSNGVVLFSTTTGTNGNDNNTIDTCDITAGATTPNNSIFSSGTTTTTATNNSGNVVTNSNISNYFGASTSSNGISISSGTTDWTISNNKFFQTATRTQTSSTTHTAILVSNSTSGNNFQITGNTIGFASSAGTGTYTFVGTSTSQFVPISLSVGTTSATSVQGNTISNIAMSGSSSGTTTSAPFRGIYVSAGLANIGNVTGNTIGSLSATGNITYTSSSASTSDVVGIYDNSSSNVTVSNNNIGGITASSTGGAASNIYAIRTGTSTTPTFTCQGNTVGGTVANSILSTTTSSSSIVNGILDAGPAGTITGNTIRNLTAAGGTLTQTSASVAGVVMNASSVNHTVSQNTIHTLTNTSAASATVINGINFNSSTGTNTIARNFIHSFSAASTTAVINGIEVIGGTATYKNNMIRLGVDASGNSVTTACPINGIKEQVNGTNNFFNNSVYIGGAGVGTTVSNTFAFTSTITLNTRSYQDNIFFNARSNATTGGKHYAVQVGGTTANPSGLTINYNVYNVTGTGGVFGLFNSVDRANLAAWKTAVGQDANSFSSDPQFLTPNGTSSTVDLHINPSITTVVEGNGLLIASVTDDFDGDTRASFTPTDIGADAGNFTGIDLTAPNITYTPLANTTSTSARTLTATISDTTGVPTSGVGLPVLYWKVNAGSYTAATASSLGGGQYQFSFGSGVNVNDTVSYYVVAEDTASPPNVGANPSTGAGNFTADPPAAGTPPTTPNSYLIQASISGSFTVGAAGNYTSLTAAINDLNSKVITAPVTMNLTDATYGAGETFPININANSGASAINTVTIKPASGATVAITGSSASALLVVNGADFVTVDGSNSGTSSRDLTMTNTNTGTSSAVIWMQTTTLSDAATSNTVKNVNLVGNSTTTTLFGVGSGSSTISTTSLGTGNSNNTIQNNNVSKTQYGIFSQGASAANKNSGNIISQNLINTASPNNVGVIGILVGFENNIQITQNTVSGMAQTSSPDVFGISLGITGISTSTFTGNEVTNATVSRNNIGSIRNTGTFSACGIAVAPATSGTNTIVNNVLTGVSANATSGDFTVGILIGGGAGSTTNVYFNSVSLSGTQTGGSDKSYCLAIGGSNPTVDIRDNVLYNTQNNGTGNNYSIGFGYSTFTALTSNFNDFFVTADATHFIGATGSLSSPTNQTTLANLQTATGKDANSQAADPLFNSLTNLQPQTGSPVVAAGTPIAGVTIDFTGATRSGSTPSEGAYENPSDSAPPTIVYTPLGNTTATTSRTLTATITDASGVPTAGVGLPVLYWKINAGSYTPAQGSFIGSNQYQFSFGSGVNTGDTVSYYVVAQDSASPPNVIANPSTGAGGYTANPPAAATPPTTPSSYTILTSISGSFTVGSGGNYTTVTAAISDINSKVITGPVTLNLTDATYPTESFPITINANGGSSASNTLTIKPASGQSVSINGSSTTSIFKLNGADFVIIDGSNSGGTDRSLTVTNTNTGTTSAVMWVGSVSASDGATSNTIKNCVLTGNSSTTTLMGIYSGGSSISTSSPAAFNNSGNIYRNNQITKAQYGIFVNGVSTSSLDSGLQIIGNNVGTATGGFNVNGITAQFQTGASIQGNVVQNVVGTGGLLDVAASSTVLTGINLRQSKLTTINGNAVFNISYNDGANFNRQHAISLECPFFNTVGSPSQNLVSNNMVYGNTYAGGGSTWTVSGINLNGGFGDGIYFNSVYMSGIINTTGGPAAAFSNGNASTTVTNANIIVRDNVFQISGGTGTSSSAPLYAHYTRLTSYSGATINNNVLFPTNAVTSSNAFVGFINSVNQTTLANWQTATTQEASSFSSNPQFNSTTDLHINPSVATIVESNGVTIAGITTDFDGDTRNATTPDIGADEGNFIAVVANDVQATAFIDPTNGGSKLVNTNFTPVASFTNNGTANQTNVPVRYRIIGPSPSMAEVYNQTATIATLNSLSTQNASFPAANISVTGTYTVKAKAELVGDQVSANDEITGTITIDAPLNGNYNIGAAGNFTTLTQAVSKLNGVGVSGPVTLTLTDSSYSTGETFPLVINAIPGAGAANTVTIKPAASTTVTVTASTTVIKLNGADFVTIDGSNSGGTDRSLTLVDNDTGTTSAAIWIGSASASDGASNNTVKNVILTGNAGTTTLAGIIAGSGTTIGNAAEAANNNNTLLNNQISKVQNGIFVSGFATTLDQNWSVTGNSIGSTVSTDKLGFRGIFLQNAQNFAISSNTIFGVVSSTTTSSTMSGIHVSGTLNTGSILANSISDVKQTNTDGWGSNGIFLAATSTTSNLTVANNVIYDVASQGFAGSSSADNGYGIMINSGGGYNLFFNSVSMTTNQVATGGITAAINISSSVTTSGTLDLRDNVFANTQTVGVRYAIYSGATSSVYSNINYNDYYQGTGVLGFIGGVDQTTITAWRTATGKDANSFSSDPKFNSTTDLRPQPTSPLLAAGTPAGGITTDFAGITRSATTPSVGAFESGADVTGPAISYTALGNTSGTASRNLTGVVITDTSGVNTTAGTRPRIYFKKSTEPNQLASTNTSAATGWKFQQSTGAGPFNFQINYSIIFGGSVTTGDTVQYFVDAQDLATIPNVSINSGTFAATPSSVALTTAAFPIGGAINSYSILPSLSGTKTVGTGGDYATITAAVAALNGSVLNGALTLSLADATYPSETYPIVINSNGGSSATNTVTIKPNTGQNVTLSATTTLFKLNGADFVTIDGSNNGSTSRNLTLNDNDTGTASAAIWIASASSTDGATSNTIKNCIMSGNASTTTLAGIIAGSGTTIGNPADASNASNTIQNNLITRFQNGIYQNGNATTLAQNWVITGNTIGSSIATDMMGFRGILFQNAQNFSVTNNTIVGVSTATTSTATGIIATGTISGGTINGNIIGNITNTNLEGWGAIGLWLNASSTASNLTVTNNAIYDVAAEGYDGGTSSADNGYGIMIDAGGGYKVFYNSVSLSVEEANGIGIPAAINIGSGVTTSSTIDLRDNIFYTSQTLGTPYAIYSSAAASVYGNINFNDYFATAGILGNIGATDETTITAWRSGTGKDVNSISANPLYNSTTNLQPQLGAPVLGVGTPISGVTTDILGVTRSATTPSMGAYENGADTIGPAIVYTPLANTSTTGSRILTATVTDASGVPSSGIGLPVLYWKINSGSYTSATASSIGMNQYQFTFGSGANSGDTVSYYVVAQDSASPANVSANPSTGAGNFTSNPPAAGTPPTTPNSYTILGTLSGGKTVGAGGDYATITAAVAALNNSVVSGPVTFTLTDATYASETFPITINANPGSSASNTITFKPAASQTVSISGSSSSSIFKLNGASYVMIDGSNSGGTDRSMTIANTNTSTSSAVIWLLSPTASAGATNNTVKNCVITGNASTTTGYGIISGGTTIGSSALAANSSNNIQNNFISKAQFAIDLLGTSTAILDQANFIVANTLGSSTADHGFSVSAIQAQYQNFIVIAGNDVQNLTSSGTAGSNHYGIGILDTKNATITANKVHFTRYTGTSTDKFFGILTQTATFNSSGSPSNNTVTNNMVYDMTSTSTSGFWAESGIDDEGGYGDKFYFNSVYLTGSLSGGASATAAAFANGNDFTGSPATNIDLRDNIFYLNGTSSFTTQFYAHYTAATTYAGSTLNYNDLKCTAAGSATANIGKLNSTSYTTLSSWQSATGQEANSISSDPLFVSTTDLHIANASSPVANAGTPISGVTTDIDGVTRNVTAPYIGADELSASISTSGTLSAVDTTYGTASTSPTSFTVSGNNLTNNLTVTPPAGFELSTSISSGYMSSLSLTPSSGTVPNTTIYVRLAATTDVGTYSGNIVCASAPAASQNVATASSMVSAKNLTITGLTGDNKVYDHNTSATFSGTPTLVGIANGDSIGLGGSPTAAFTNIDTGTGKTINVSGYTLTGTKAFDYTLTQPTLTGDITPKGLTITGLMGDNKTYDSTTGATFSGVPVLNGVIGSDNGNVALSGTPTAMFSNSDVGTGKTITVSGYTLAGSRAFNYTVSQPLLTGDITQKGLTITGLTGDNKVYDRTTSATFSGMAALNGVFPSDSSNVILGGSPTASFADFDTGTGKTITVMGFTISGSRAFNYTLTQPTLTADITPKGLTVTGLTGDDKVYDRTTTATFSGAPVLNGVIAGDTANVHLGGSATASFADFDAGTGKTITVMGYTLTGTRAFNYTVTQPTLTADITPKNLTITGLTGDDKVYDRTTTATFSGTPVLSGVIAGDSGNVTLGGTATASFADFDVGTGKTITVMGYTLTGSRAFNYTVTQPTLTADITPKGLTITGLTGDDKVYDRTTAATFSGMPALNGVIAGDTGNVGLGGTPTASFANFDVGNGKTITVSGYTLIGTRAFNYTVTQPTLTADITPKNLTITGLTGDDKVYDRTTTATFTGAPVLNGVIAGDTANVHLGGSPTASFANFDVGTGKTVTVSGYTLTGTRAFNYTVSQPTLTADITPKGLTITGLTGDDKQYDRTTNATFSGTPVLSGVIAGDTGNVGVGGTPTASFADFNAGMNKTITVSGFTLTGTRAFNYTLTQPTLTADITPKPLSITADSGQYKSKGSSDPTLTYSQMGLIAPDTISGSMTRDAGETPGSYAINQGSLSAGSNYTINFSSAQFVIAGPLATGDEATRPNAATSFNIPLADLLANDTRIANDGSSQTDQLSVTMVTSGTGNTVIISGSNVVYTPDDPNATADLTFTYTLLDSATGTTDIGTVTVHTQNNGGALAFEVTDIVSAPNFNGTTTSITVSCTATPSQTITIEYSTNLVTWTSIPGSFSTGTGTFNVTVTAAGDQTAAWNAGMFFRATR